LDLPKKWVPAIKLASTGRSPKKKESRRNARDRGGSGVDEDVGKIRTKTTMGPKNAFQRNKQGGAKPLPLSFPCRIKSALDPEVVRQKTEKKRRSPKT